MEDNTEQIAGDGTDEAEARKMVWFMDLFDHFQYRVHKNAIMKGFYDEQVNVAEQLALIHSEVSEALEYARHGNPKDDKIPEFSGLEAELADIVIRVMSLAGEMDWDVAGAIGAKIAYNKTRPYMHGGKLF